MLNHNLPVPRRLFSALLITSLLLLAIGNVEGAIAQQQPAACGTWIAERDPRIEVVAITQQENQDCGGLFRLKNDTDIDFSLVNVNIASWGGYTLDLRATHDNNKSDWVMLNNKVEKAYLLPIVYTNIYAYPVDRTLGAKTTIQGDVTGRSIAFDGAFFLVRSALALALGNTDKCILSHEQLVSVTFKVYDISATAASLAFRGKWKEATQEYLRIADEFFEEVKNAFLELKIGCAAEAIARSIIGKPFTIVKIGTSLLGWAASMAFDYLKYDGKPATVSLIYTPNQAPVSTSLPTSIPRPTPDLVTGQKIAFVSDRDGNEEIYITNSDGTGLTNLTNNSAKDWDPAWSPDGQKLAFLSDRNGASEIYVMNADGADVHQITNLGTRVSTPIWSPDGKRIAFRAGDQSVYWTDSDGNNLTKVYGAGSTYSPVGDISWSPDGLQLLFSERLVDSDVPTHYRSDLFVVNLDGTGLQTLADSELPEYWPAWSPDGQRIAFVRRSTIQINGLGSHVFLVNRDGNQEFNLTENITTACCPQWSPDGQRLAFFVIMNLGQGLDRGLYVTRVDDWQLIRVHEGSSDFSWSPEGQYLTFSSGSDIYVIAIDGSSLANLTEGSGNDSNPVWQPVARPQPQVTVSDQTIAFVSNRDGNDEIYTINADGSGLTNLTNNPASDSGPAWSPNGQNIAFASNRSGEFAIYVMNADGSNVRRVTTIVAGGLVWSPDGRRIAITQTMGRPGADQEVSIYWVNVDGSELTRVFNQLGYGGGITWSPDSQQLLFSACCDFDLWRVNLDGSSLQRFASSDRWELEPTWSPDGRQVAFASDRDDGYWDIWVVDHDGGQAINLTSVPYLGQERGPIWSPNNQHLAFSSLEGLHIVQVSTGQIAQVDKRSYSGYVGQWTWSPDSRQIAFAPDGDIYVVGIDGGNLINLTNNSSNDWNPTWQPLVRASSGITLSDESIVGVYKGLVTTSGEGGSAEGIVAHETSEYVVEIKPVCGPEEGSCIELRLIDPNSSAGGSYCPIQDAVDSVCFHLLPDGSLSYDVFGAGWGASGILYKVDETSLTPVPALTSTPIQGDSSSCANAFGNRLRTGDSARVLVFQLAMRDQPGGPGYGSQTHVVARNRIVTVLEGPVCMNSQYYLRARSELGTEGWVAEGDSEGYFLEPAR
jgi:Tol biopolymer transport system component